MPRILKTAPALAEKHFASRGKSLAEIAECVQSKTETEIVIDLDCALPKKRPAIENRPAPTVEQVATFAQAVIRGKYVDDDTRLAREAVCANCDKQKMDTNGVPWCAVCGCGTSNAERQIRNLAAYEENLPKWGCKHPERKNGKGWPLLVIGCGGGCGCRSR